MKVKVMVFVLVLFGLLSAQENTWKVIKGSLPGRDNMKQDELLMAIADIDTATQFVKIVGLTDSAGWTNKPEDEWAAADTSLGLKRARAAMDFYIRNGIPANIADPAVETLNPNRGVRVMIADKSIVHSRTVIREMETELDPLWFNFIIEPDTTIDTLAKIIWESNAFKTIIPFFGQQGSVGEQVIDLAGDSGWVKLHATAQRDSEEVSASDSIFVSPIEETLFPLMEEAQQEREEETPKTVPDLERNWNIKAGIVSWKADTLTGWTPTLSVSLNKHKWSWIFQFGYNPFKLENRRNLMLSSFFEFPVWKKIVIGPGFLLLQRLDEGGWKEQIMGFMIGSGFKQNLFSFSDIEIGIKGFYGKTEIYFPEDRTQKERNGFGFLASIEARR